MSLLNLSTSMLNQQQLSQSNRGIPCANTRINSAPEHPFPASAQRNQRIEVTSHASFLSQEVMSWIVHDRGPGVFRVRSSRAGLGRLHWNGRPQQHEPGQVHQRKS